ncbi:MAG TPA: hypothetical protein VHB69_12755 [Mycobacteriales bacterium]|nr:hypothetical protein [Mycobacteriales bacterium]
MRRAELLAQLSDSGALALSECLAAGLTRRQLHWLVTSGRWQSPFPRVYVSFSGPLPAATTQHAALLYAGEGAALSHESAGALWRLCPTPAAVHVLVPYRRQVDGQPGLELHRSRTLCPADIHPALTPRRTTVERTVLDLLSRSKNADHALGLVGEAIRTRVTTAGRLRSAVTAKPRTRWRQVVLDALPDLALGAHSPLELRDAAIRRSHGLPQGTRQARRLGDGTEYLDVLIEEYGVHIELDGRLGHDRTRERWRDMRRDNRSELLRLRHLRYGWADLVDRPCAVAREQAEVLAQQGWPGPFRPCARCA